MTEDGRFDERRLIQAVLVWDIRAISEANSPGATAFRNALGPGPWQDIERGDDVLSQAAWALLQERNGNLEAALPGYGALVDSSDAWVSLLGLCLLAWTSAPDGDAALERAAEVVSSLPRSQLKARLLSKLAGLADDRHSREMFARCVLSAVEVAAEGTQLRRALVHVAHSAGLSGWPVSNEDGYAGDDDPLVKQAWIDDLALRSARGELTELLRSRARSPWSWQFNVGRTPADEIIAAELQATWAGALWKRSELQLQVGAQLLQGHQASVQAVVYGLSMWIRGGGDHIAQVIARCEPQFEQTTADQLLKPLVAGPKLPGLKGYRLAQMAVALWDELSEDVIRRLLDHLDPAAGVEPAIDEVRRFWCAAAVRLPSETATRLTHLDPEVQVALLSELPHEGLERLPDDVVETLVALLEERSINVGALAYAEMRLRSRAGVEARAHTDLPPREVAEAVLRDAAAVPSGELAHAEQELLQTFHQEVEQARQGSVGVGGRPTAASLAMIARAKGGAAPETLDALSEVASDKRLPGHLRVDALVALAQLSVADLVPTRILERLASTPEHGTAGFFAPTPPELLRVSRLLARARILDENEEAQLFSLVRDKDARIRQLAVDAAGLVLRERSSPTLVAAVIAGLFDPDEDVVRHALGSLGDAKLEQVRFHDAIVERLQALFSERGRYVRAETVTTARALTRSGHVRPELVALLARAQQDRSWIVRDAAARPFGQDANSPS